MTFCIYYTFSWHVPVQWRRTLFTNISCKYWITFFVMLQDMRSKTRFNACCFYFSDIQLFCLRNTNTPKAKRLKKHFMVFSSLKMFPCLYISVNFWFFFSYPIHRCTQLESRNSPCSFFVKFSFVWMKVYFSGGRGDVVETNLTEMMHDLMCTFQFRFWTVPIFIVFRSS